MELWGSLSNQSSLLVEFQTTGRPCLKERWIAPEGQQPRLSSGFHMCAHITYSCTYILIVLVTFNCCDKTLTKPSLER